MAEMGLRRINTLGSSAFNTADAQFCIFNPRSISQVVRRLVRRQLQAHHLQTIVVIIGLGELLPAAVFNARQRSCGLTVDRL
jgi:hypothetical protein